MPYKNGYCPFCYDIPDKCECDKDALNKLLRFHKTASIHFYAKDNTGEYYRCNHQDGHNYLKNGPKCDNRISKRLVEKTDGKCLNNHDGSSNTYCVKHVPKCYLLPKGCETYELCNACHYECCMDCGAGCICTYSIDLFID